MAFLSPNKQKIRWTMKKERMMTNRWIWLLGCLYFSMRIASGTVPDESTDLNVYLDESSVVLITGAAGFLGSELALALWKTYRVAKIIAIDSMDRGFGEHENHRSESDLALFEFKRQRMFRLMQSIPNLYFYRVDFRPSIPEYFDSSEVPVLHAIFQEHGYHNITHVVHLADQTTTTTTHPQVIPRTRGQEKAGMMESLLEQFVLIQKTTTDANNKQPPLPRFVYASSGDVYSSTAPPPFSEDRPLTTPHSVRGTSKLIDEMLALAYYEKYHIPSIALRVFEVYGPWGLPGSRLFEAAEAVVTATSNGEEEDRSIHDETNPQVAEEDEYEDDFIFIDDAVDAIMAAMQLGTTQAISINVGSGKSNSYTQVSNILRKLAHLSPLPEQDPRQEQRRIRYANLERAQTFLGFTPRVDLETGLEILLAWHFDRAFPYATSNHVPVRAQCSKYDTDCLRGTPVFPCASECATSDFCKESLWDDVLTLTRAMTDTCENQVVLYTVALDPDVDHLPNAFVRFSTQSIAFVPGKHCNIAFVNVDSPLYTQFGKPDPVDGILKHGYWSLVPVVLTQYSISKIKLWSLLPKLSPGQFFGDNIQKAIYCDPDIIFDSIPRLLEESNMQPAHPTVQGSTVLLIGKKEMDVIAQQQPQRPSRTPTPHPDLVQETAYRTIRMAVIEHMAGDGFAQKIDSSFMVHDLTRNPDDNNHENDNDDGRLFRCDVFGEVLQWGVDTDRAALEFILGLHDMWSRVMVRKTGMEPWWIGEDVSTVAGAQRGGVLGGGGGGQTTTRRRLQEIPRKNNPLSKKEPAVDSATIEMTTKNAASLGQNNLQNHRRLLKDEEKDGKAGVIIQDPDSDDEEDTDAEEQNGVLDNQRTVADEHNGFGVVVQEAFEAVFGYGKKQERFDRPQEGALEEGEEGEDKEADDFVVEDDKTPRGDTDDANGRGNFLDVDPTDPSSYDVWMGVLSSTDVRYFARIVSMKAVGAYRVTQEIDSQLQEL
jgi:UDP-glucuronate 4-epimerase